MSVLRIEPSNGTFGNERGIYLHADGVHTSASTLNTYFRPLGYVIVPADAIVIERSALPEVDAREWLSAGDSALDPAEVAMGVEFVRSKARDYLALAEYLDAHPPVDEAQVSAMVKDSLAAIHEGIDPGDGHRYERFMVARGWHKDADR